MSQDKNVKKCVRFEDVSDVDKESVARAILPCVEDYFKKPGVEEDFQIWLAKRRKKLCLV